jgi:GNAT superfamily N-acetyltransferase
MPKVPVYGKGQFCAIAHPYPQANTMVHIRPMTADDVALGLRLSQQANWNQTEADWRRLLDLQPDGCFVAESDGTAVGTTTTTIFGPVAWIAMVLVEESARGHGIGKALVGHALDVLDRRRVPTVRLDATALGQHLYEGLGFVEQYALARYEGTPPRAMEMAASEPASSDEWERLAILDQAITGIDRRALLSRLFAEQPADVRLDRVGAQLAGYLTARPGRRAVQIGPCIASPEGGPPLFADAFHRYAGHDIYVDIPISNAVATRVAEAHGLTVQRSFARMCRGRPQRERIEWLWASSGPENG